MSGKCAWCNRSDGVLQELQVRDGGALIESDRTVVFVHAEHRERVCDYYRHFARWKMYFISAFLLLPFLLVVGAVMHSTGIIWGRFMLAGSVAAMGVVLLVLPFATPQTERAFGIARAKRLARLSAVLLLTVAAVVLLR